jgi:hypothetical protein
MLGPITGRLTPELPRAPGRALARQCLPHWQVGPPGPAWPRYGGWRPGAPLAARPQARLSLSRCLHLSRERYLLRCLLVLRDTIKQSPTTAGSLSPPGPDGTPPGDPAPV